MFREVITGNLRRLTSSRCAHLSYWIYCVSFLFKGFSKWPEQVLQIQNSGRETLQKSLLL